MLKKLLCVSLVCCLTLAAFMPAAAQNGYSDVPEGIWFYDYVTDLSQKGVRNG